MKPAGCYPQFSLCDPERHLAGAPNRLRPLMMGGSILNSVDTRSEVADYINPLNIEARKLALAAHKVLDEEGCNSYVKTIYIGYEIDGQMVAALYAYADHLEVALALPEDAEGASLIDATHLTWKTLPVAAVIRGLDDLVEFKTLASLAAARVRSQSHDVERDNDYFIKARREQSDPNTTQTFLQPLRRSGQRAKGDM